jgi:ribonuclease D
MWTPPAPEAVAAQLTSYGARPWQVDLVTPVLVDAILRAQPEG